MPSYLGQTEYCSVAPGEALASVPTLYGAVVSKQWSKYRHIADPNFVKACVPSCCACATVPSCCHTSLKACVSLRCRHDYLPFARHLPLYTTY